ncbi:MAG: gliding motility-associated C-terminal domain-containing protein [Bacteroidales bacterium]|jgi:gliding motility-associated-like protein|nr:gliding motility-associated C-terminal domain-containing protein [Bacteroidales bacterium]
MANKELKKMFENFEVIPDENLWNNIQKKINRTATPKWIVLSSSIGFAISLIFIFAIVLSPKENREKKEEIQKNISNNSHIEKINSNNDEKIQTNTSLKTNTTIKNNKAITINNEELVSLNKDKDIIKANKIQTNISPKLDNKLYFSTNETKTSIDEIIKNYENSSSNNDNENASLENDSNKKDFHLFIPNTFTPKESINNIFSPAFANLKNFEMKIFNRNGLLLYSTKDINKGWNGYYNGRLQRQGQYVYIINYETLSGERKTQKGVVNLL